MTTRPAHQANLLYQPAEWHHFIGGHYASPESFVAEAQKQGISRRIPAQNAKGMSFGDRVVLLRFVNAETVIAFAEMVVSRVMLDGEITQKIGNDLQEAGRASYQENGGAGEMVNRECGEYLIAGTWQVDPDVDIAELIRMAERYADGEKLFVMLGGELSQVYATHRLLNPPPKFTRGFARRTPRPDFFYNDAPASDERVVYGVRNYQKAAPRRKPARHEAQGELL